MISERLAAALMAMAFGLGLVVCVTVQAQAPASMGVNSNVHTGPIVPATCNQGDVFMDYYVTPAGQMTIFSIWLCGPNGKYQKPLLYKQVEP